MEISGRLIKILQEVRGESQRGPWVRGGFVIETDGDYPRQVAFTTFGEDRLAMVKSIPLNTPVVVNFNPESREYEGRWYTDLRSDASRSHRLCLACRTAGSSRPGCCARTAPAACSSRSSPCAASGSLFCLAPWRRRRPAVLNVILNV